MRKYLVATIGLLFGLTSGCADMPDYKPVLPDQLGNNGLVVGQVLGIGSLRFWSFDKDVFINERRKGAVINSFIAIPLAPGEYEFSSLFSKSAGGSGYYGGVTVSMTNTSTLPVKRKFTVHSKQITNLGLLVLVPVPDPNHPQQQKFSPMFVDNTEDMKHFIKTAYPSHAPHSDAMSLAAGHLMPADVLHLLRKQLATEKAGTVDKHASQVVSDLGTVADIRRGNDGKLVDLKLIKVPTVANLQSESTSPVLGQTAFLTTTNRLFLVKNGNVVEKKAPLGLRSASVYIIRADELLIVDDKFEIYASYDGGDHWEQYLGALSSKKNYTWEVGVSAGTRGYYVHTADPPRALFTAYRKFDFKSVDLPKDLKSLGLLREKPAGIYAEHTYSVYMETKQRVFFFQPLHTSAWETRTMPAPNCEHIEFLDDDGFNVATKCWDRAVGSRTLPIARHTAYESKDGGISWSRK